MSSDDKWKPPNQEPQFLNYSFEAHPYGRFPLELPDEMLQSRNSTLGQDQTIEKRFVAELGHSGVLMDGDAVEIRCECCGSAENLEYGPDPYAAEIHGDYSPVWLCKSCEEESARDI